MGPIFCQVERIRQDIHEMDAMVDGSQKWKGAIPSFVRSPIMRQRILTFSDISDKGLFEREIPPHRRNPEPSAWAKKYLIAASVSWYSLDCMMSGIKDIKLISRPIHMTSH